jgi:hypothetical protein
MVAQSWWVQSLTGSALRAFLGPMFHFAKETFADFHIRLFDGASASGHLRDF